MEISHKVALGCVHHVGVVKVILSLQHENNHIHTNKG